MRFLREDFPRAVRALETLHGLGATKHPNMESLRRPDAVEHNLGRALNHIKEHNANPEIPDPEDGLPHTVHATWRIMAWLEASLAESGEV